MDIIYENTVDRGAFSVRVVGTEKDGEGRLTVVETSSEDVLLDELVGLSYGAIFGPDVADVADWQNKAIEVIDKRIKENK